MKAISRHISKYMSRVCERFKWKRFQGTAKHISKVWE